MLEVPIHHDFHFNNDDLRLLAALLNRNPQLDRIEAALALLNQEETAIMTDLTALQAEVERNTTVEQSAVALLQGLKTQLDAAGTDPAKLKTLSDQLAGNTDALAAAITANTPAAPAA